MSRFGHPRLPRRASGCDPGPPPSGPGPLAVRLADRPAKLTRKEFDLLHFLASQPGTTFTRSQLLEAVWDFAWDGDTATVTVHVRRLREKIEADAGNPRHLVTVWGVGYRFDP